MTKKRTVVGKSATMGLSGKDGTLSGKIISQDTNGVWLTLNDETSKKLGVSLPRGDTQTDLFMPFSSISWMTVA